MPVSAVLGREGDVLRPGEPGRVQPEVAGRAQDLGLPAVDVDPQDDGLAAPGRPRRRPPRALRRDVPEDAEGHVELAHARRRPRGRRAGRRRRGRRRTRPGRRRAARTGSARTPTAARRCRCRRRRRARRSSCGRLRYSDQKSVRSLKNHSARSVAPDGLDDRLPGTAGQHVVGAVGGADDQLGGVPRHVRVVPLQPRQRHAVRAPAAGRTRSRARRPAPRELRRRSTRTISLTTSAARSPSAWVSRTASTPVGHDAEVGVPHAGRHRRLRRHRDRGVAAGVEPVQPLVGELGEPQRAVLHRPRAAAVLVHPGAGVPRAPGGRRCTVPSAERRTITDRPPSAGRDSDHQTSSPSTHDLAEPGRGADDELGGDRGRPAAVGERKSCL